MILAMFWEWFKGFAGRIALVLAGVLLLYWMWKGRKGI
jgi:hypothetical protein